MESYFKKIDELRKRVNCNDTVTLDEACWLLYAELYVLADVYTAFKKRASNLGLNNLTWVEWKEAFHQWEDDKR